MTNWHILSVPYSESPLARDAGAVWSAPDRAWCCTATQFRCYQFKRWRDKSAWRRITIHVADGPRERAEARTNKCLWDATRKCWYITVTADSSINAWHRARLAPPTVHRVRVEYSERHRAKEAGARWLPEERCWVFRAHGAPPGWVVRRSLAGTY